MTSREFNHDTSGAKRAAERGPGYTTDRGRPAPVLPTIEPFEQLVGPQRVLDLLAEPAGVEDVEFTLPTQSDPAGPASLDTSSMSSPR